MVAQRPPLPPGEGRGEGSLLRAAALLFCTAVSLSLAAGCGGPELAPVSGKITVASQPATRGTVTFMPEGTKGTSGKAAVGEIGPDGAYTLRTFDPGDGAIVGHHRVLISGRGLEDAENVPPDARIPLRYSNPQKSDLTKEVRPGPNKIDFDLKP